MLTCSNEMKQLLLIVGLGIGIWGLGLFWPYINHFLTPVATAMLILGLATILLAYIVLRDQDHNDRNGKSEREHHASPPKLFRLNNHS
jgi:hypothetical protein